MGSRQTKPSNKSMVDRLVNGLEPYIQSPAVESAFRGVDRRNYFDLREGEAVDPYDDDPWRRGNLHISAPGIYAKVVEALELRPGLSFLNLGSGTGYLNTIIGLLIGPNGINHGVEVHQDVVDFAYKKLQLFKETAHAIDKFNFSEPLFIRGNILKLNPGFKYDRIYLGAACLPDLEDYMKKLIKPFGGILIMPFQNRLLRYTRINESHWEVEQLMNVNFTLMIELGKNEPLIDLPLAQAKSLKELCRISIRQHLRDKTNLKNPSLLYSDNIGYRNLRRARAARDKSRHNRTQNTANKPLHEGRCCFWNNGRDDVTDRGSRSQHPQPAQSKPGTSNDTRVITRSVNRRLETNDNGGVHCSSSPAPRGANLTRAATIFFGASPGDSEEEEDEEDPRGSRADDNERGDDDHDHDGDDEGNDDNHSDNNRSSSTVILGTTSQSSARTRPFVCNATVSRARNNRPSNGYSTLIGGSLQARRLIHDPIANILPYQRRIARIIDPPTSESAPESDMSDMQDIDEFDFSPNVIGRQVVLDWPGVLRIHHDEDDLDIHGFETSSSSSSDSFGIEHRFRLDEGTNSESSVWVESILGGIYTDCDSIASSQVGSLALDSSSITDDDNDEDDNEDEDNSRNRKLGRYSSYIRSNWPRLSDTAAPRPGTSRSVEVGANGDEEQSEQEQFQPIPDETNDQQPVASRLRSRRNMMDPDADNFRNTGEGASEHRCRFNQRPDRPMPSCSRRNGNASSYENSRKHSRCSFVSSNKRARFRCSIHNRSGMNLEAPPPRLVDHPAPGSTANGQPTESAPPPSLTTSFEPQVASSDRSSYHGSVVSSNNSNNDQSNEECGGSFAGRFLIATALSSTLSMSSRHFPLPELGHQRRQQHQQSGSLGLYERHSVGTSGGSSSSPGHQQQASKAERQGGKRKRHSSPDSSEVSSNTSSSTRRHHHCRNRHRRHRHHHRRHRRRCCCCLSIDHDGLGAVQSAGPASSNPDSRSIDINTCKNRSFASMKGTNNHANQGHCQQEAATVSSSISQPSSIQAEVAGIKSEGARAETGGQNPPARSLGVVGEGRDALGLSPTHLGRSHVRTCRRSKHQSTSQRHTYHQHRCTHHLHQHYHHHHHHHHQRHHERHNSSPYLVSSQSASATGVQHSMVLDFNEISKQGRQPEKRKQMRRESECERYYNHISNYICQLPLPRVLHNYLNYDRVNLAAQRAL